MTVCCPCRRVPLTLFYAAPTAVLQNAPAGKMLRCEGAEPAISLDLYVYVLSGPRRNLAAYSLQTNYSASTDVSSGKYCHFSSGSKKQNKTMALFALLSLQVVHVFILIQNPAEPVFFFLFFKEGWKHSANHTVKALLHLSRTLMPSAVITYLSVAFIGDPLNLNLFPPHVSRRWKGRGQRSGTAVSVGLCRGRHAQVQTPLSWAGEDKEEDEEDR